MSSVSAHPLSVPYTGPVIYNSQCGSRTKQIERGGQIISFLPPRKWRRGPEKEHLSESGAGSVLPWMLAEQLLRKWKNKLSSASFRAPARPKIQWLKLQISFYVITHILRRQRCTPGRWEVIESSRIHEQKHIYGSHKLDSRELKTDDVNAFVCLFCIF